MNLPIVTAIDSENRNVRIEDAESGMRYRGASQDHRDCVLYARFPKYRRPSFAHMPNREHLCGRGESALHRATRKRWFRLFQSQLSGCRACIINGIELDDHYCFVWLDYSEARPVAKYNPRPFWGKIVWTCSDCLRPHVWDLLKGADSVISDQKVPTLDSRIRPDITILDETGRSLAFIEFLKSHLSESVEELAKDLNIPLFIVDIGNASQSGLYNPRRGMWTAIAESTQISEELAAEYRKADEFNYRMAESMAAAGGTSSSFSAIPDEHGNYVDAVFHAIGKSNALPDPAIGGYLVASRVDNLPCERQLEAQSGWSDILSQWTRSA